MRIERRFTKEGQSAYADISARPPARSQSGRIDRLSARRTSRFRPAWSQVAADILAQKYFRKAGVPARLKKVEENSVPSWLWRSVADDTEALAELPEDERYGSETDPPARSSTAWPAPGPTGAGRAATSTCEEDARAFYDELAYMLATQRVAPNSPQWFNTGLHWAYGIDGPGQGHFYVDFETGKLTKSNIGLRAPAAACLLHPVGLRRPGQRRRHHGPVGARSPPVQIRLRHRLQLLHLRGEGEKLSGGGKSSGLMSFLKIGDRAAGAIKSGGTTRRAAKMVVVDIDHPDIEAYINWKVKEEQKVAALVTGSKIVKKHLKAIMKACVNCDGPDKRLLRPGQEPCPQARHQGCRKAHGAGKLHQARHPVRIAGLHRDRVRHL
jgi:ribonucleoside-diphosphate reductase alpha chain